jgi:hypothetical protein
LGHTNLGVTSIYLQQIEQAREARGREVDVSTRP